MKKIKKDDIPTLFKYARLRVQKTPREAREISGVEYHTLRNWEKGDRCPTFEMGMNYLLSLGISLDELFSSYRDDK